MSSTEDDEAQRSRASAEGDEARRRRSIELLEANHQFPCDFSVSVIARNDEAVTRAIVAAVSEVATLAPGAHDRRESGGGKYVSHRLVVPCPTPEAVLDLYARVRAVDGVITVL